MAFQYAGNAKEKISAVGTKLGNIGNLADGSQLRNDPVVSPAADETVSKIVKEWQQELLAHLKPVTRAPEVSKSSLCDARELFGDNFKKGVPLRKSDDLEACEEISLLQFDPNFTSSEVICRHPSCSAKNSEAAKSGTKRDLFLCRIHQEFLRDSISDLLAKKETKLSTRAKKPKHGHYAGYTSLISLLEVAYHDAKKFQTLKGKSLLIQEAILNVRNFLIITNCLLNPDDENLETALEPVFQILHRIFENSEDVNDVIKSIVFLINILRKVIESILFSFGVIYHWVAIHPGNPGSRIGCGVGIILGAGAFFLGPWSGAAGMTIGGTTGGLIGNGIHSLITGGQRNRELQQFRERWWVAGNNQNPIYFVEGCEAGELTLAVELLKEVESVHP